MLRILSSLFGAAVRLRAGAYRAGLLRTRRVPVPVIVVGNLAVGGTGKTPLVIWLAEQLQALGRHPGIVLRGYGGRATGGRSAQLVSEGSDPAAVGDEAVLLRLRTRVPVAAHRDRVKAAQLLLEEGVDIIVSDDGLQHLGLARDFEIIVIDGARGLGNGYLLPAGPLRELPARVRRADCLVFNGQQNDGGERDPAPPFAISALTMEVGGSFLTPLSGSGESTPLSKLAGQRVHAVAGIGNPTRFFRQLAAAGLLLIEHPFPDHHRYRAQDVEFGDGLPVLMTEKDAVKCRRIAGVDGWYLPVTASFAGKEATVLLERLKSLWQ